MSSEIAWFLALSNHPALPTSVIKPLISELQKHELVSMEKPKP